FWIFLFIEVGFLFYVSYGSIIFVFGCMFHVSLVIQV
ncbi:unnamed protein product, partial [Brassica oleracea]